MNSYKYLLILSLFAFCPDAKAQQIQAKVTTNESGYNTITVPQEFRAKMANDIGMLRIKDSQKNEIPFILKPQETNLLYFSPIAYQQEKNATDSTETYFIDNKTKKKNNGYILQIVNSTDNKKYRVEGSDDMQNWFGIVNNGILTDLTDQDQTFTNKSIQFPLVDYRYVRIILDNKNSPAIRILGIGEMKNNQTPLQLEKIREISYQITNNRGDKTTLINVKKDLWTPIDYFQIHISSPKQYYRTVSTYFENENSNANKNNVKPKRIVREQLYFRTNSGDMYALNELYPRNFLIEIDNEDNPPLQIDSISFYQTPIQLVAELANKQEYSLQVDSGWSAPNYDLSKIDLDLPPNIPSADVKEIKSINVSSTSQNKDYGNFILIVCSALGVLLVFYFGRGLIRDLNKEK